MTKKRILVAGAGLVGQRHIETVTRFASLVGIVDPAPAAVELAGAYGVPLFLDIEKAIDDTKPDGVILATPNQLHIAHGTCAIERGLPVLIEKPIADKSAPAHDMVDRARSLSVPVLVGHHRRHNPKVMAAKSCIESGTIGQIATVNGQFWLYKPPEYFDATWRRQTGAGPVFINLIHDVDLLQHFCGPIRSVQAMQSNAARKFEVEDTAAILLEFENGALGTFSATDTVVAPWSWEFTAGENPAYPNVRGSAYQIGGTHGALSVPDLVVWTHKDKRSWWEPIESRELDVEDGDAFDRQCQHFVDIMNGATPLVSGEDGLSALRVIEAVKSAAETGDKIRL